MKTPNELERLIAAERAAPPQPPARSAPAGWQRLQRDMAVAVVPQFDVPPGVVETLAVAKTGASWGIVGKVLATVVITGATTTAVVATRPEPVPVIEPAHVEAIVAAAAPSSARTPAAPAIAPTPAPAIVAPKIGEGVALSPLVESAVEAGSEPPRARKPRPSVPATTPTTEPESKLERERALVSFAQRALAEAAPTRALDLLDEHARLFPHGAMAEDRDALRVVALCRAGRAAEAERRRTQFFRRWPKSLHATRVRGACDTD